MTTQNEQTSIFEWIWNELKKIFPFLNTEAQKIANLANAIVNDIKNIEGDPTYQAIYTIVVNAVEAIAPELKPLIDGLMNELNKIFSFILNIPTSTNENFIASQAVTYLKNSGDVSTTLYAGLHGTLSAVIQAYFANNTGVENTDAQLIVSSQISHLQNSRA
jgi:hypothetical protein